MQLRVPRPYGAFTPVPLLQDTNENFDPNMGLAGEGIRAADEPLATQLRHVASGDSAAFVNFGPPFSISADLKSEMNKSQVETLKNWLESIHRVMTPE